MDGKREKIQSVRFISPFSKATLHEADLLSKFAKTHNFTFDWNITERTRNRLEMREEFLKFVVDTPNVFLIGELPIFDKLIVVKNLVLVGFIKNFWFSWSLEDIHLEIDDIKGKIELTPFVCKIEQFFGKEEVHKAISCYLSEIVNVEGFMMGAEHLALWIKEPHKLFEEMTKYQEIINHNFEEVSDKLRPVSSRVTANLPLLNNYKSIINDGKIQEWLGELKQEAADRQPGGGKLPLEVERYIYVQGTSDNGQWHIEESYAKDIYVFLNSDIFKDLTTNYKTWIVLADNNRLQETYRSYKQSVKAELPDDLISNWIWFICQNNYHVLQYERSMKVDLNVVRGLATVLGKPEADLSRISAFMFADAMDPNSQPIMRRYNDYQNYLEYCKKSTTLVSDLQGFLSKFVDNNNA